MFINKKINVISFGEVLFDVFGEEKKIGGAPLNLALRTASYGFPVTMISAVGNDEDGKVILDYTKENALETAGIIVSPDYETGIVQVSLNERGSATYEIRFPSAWDFISVDEKIMDVVKEADVFFYGSLACRNEVSQKTLFSLLDSNDTMFKVFDVNLRKPFYNIQLLENLMDRADFIKFNDEEILEIAAGMGFESENLEANIKFMSEKTNTPAICVTLGKHGSILLWNDQMYRHEGYPVKVADTVGAGDSFLASLIAKLLSDQNPDEALNFASAVGALVASYSGANPNLENVEVESFMKERTC
ncbi:carbohydrate kinase [Chryseobacterium wangxinyae]|uniref:carbohydrate kinase family protein n=1 Tax=Chryseobacterium sp. CY350 TaxID=2997336 RepID=UPI002271A70D|nr:carbohydrate kinase [Chryseobacterium sp. CY350]MCY0976652.1 carbohydrate kinase [Chryseobacterium sp. CY350]WBZ96653.1 carbohydrate kinase [Chryseobacterium sp. CY350]